MGNLEKGSRKRTQRNQLRSIILESVKAAGMLSLLVIAPNVIGAMAKMGLIASSRQEYVVQKASARLVQLGLLEWHGGKLRLTAKGEMELRRQRLQQQAKTRPRRWDKKWRIIIFDIPEKRKGLRARVKHAVQSVGFIRLQDSVWVYPYDCEDLMTLLKVDFRIGDDIRYIIADTIEHDDMLRAHFKLSHSN